MKNKELIDRSEILLSKNQLHLYGYRNYFTLFSSLFEKGLLPNNILISGRKGIGKSTFVYHFVNFILTKNEEFAYDNKNFNINENNSSYNQLNDGIHPNLFIIDDNVLNKDIKIELIRNLINFINKSTFSKDLKIIIIDNSENLNLNSMNALLKVLEETARNTYFFVINSNPYKIIDTFKSRFSEFKLNLKFKDKEEIILKLLDQYNITLNDKNIINNFRHESPGNFINMYNEFLDLDKRNINDEIQQISLFMKKYENEKNNNYFNYISLLIEKFYTYLSISNINNINKYYNNCFAILTQLNDMKKYNLNEKSSFNNIKNILINEK